MSSKSQAHTFIVDVEDNTRIEGFRSAIYLATPKKPLP